MQHRFLILSLSAVLVLGGCETLRIDSRLTPQDGDSATEGGNAQRTHFQVSTLAPPLEEVWRYNGEAGFGPAALLVVDNQLVTVNRMGEVHIVDTREGRKVGTVELGEAGDGSPVIVDGQRLIVPLPAGKYGVVAYDLLTGTRAWRIRDALQSAGLLLQDDAVYAAGLDGTVRRLATQDGSEAWAIRPDTLASFYASPVALTSGSLIVADDRGHITSLDPRTGEIVWRKDVGAPVFSTPTVLGQHIVVPTTRGRVVALDANTGTVRWEYASDDPLVRFASAAATQDGVVLGGSDGLVRRLDAATGEEQWVALFDGVIAAAPLIVGNLVYVGTMNSRLSALDLESGEQRWETEVSGRIKTAPVLARNRIIVAVEPKELLAFEPVTIAQEGR